MINAVRACLNGSDKRWRSGNTQVGVHYEGIHGTPSYERTVVVKLHGNVIAEFDSACCGHRSVRGMKLSDCGWQTNTTKSRLNALLGAFREDSMLYQKQGDWFKPCGEAWHGTDWFSYGVWDSYTLQTAEAIA